MTGSDVPVLEVIGATKTYHLRTVLGATRTVEALRDVSLRLHTGRALAIVGESGSGKSTLGQATVGLFPLSSGQVLFRGRDIAQLRTRRERQAYRRAAQMVFQDPFSALNPAHTVRHHLERPLRLHGHLRGDALRAGVAQTLSDVELDPSRTADKYPHELSGGQRQRVNLARALAIGAELIVADEPTSMLDVSIRRSVLDLLARLKRERGLALLYITHDIATAHYLAEDTAVMFAGRIAEWGPSQEVVANPAHPYTRVLLSAVPNPSVRLAADAAAAAAFTAEISAVRESAGRPPTPAIAVGPDHYVRLSGD